MMTPVGPKPSVLRRDVLNVLLVFIPVAFLLKAFHVEPGLVFGASAIAIIPLALLMEKATDALSFYLGATYGGLLSATMGNAPELIIGISALRNGLPELLKGSIAGSILGTLLLGIGITMMAGGFRNPRQTFDRDMVATNSGLLVLATFGLIIPAVFHFSKSDDQEISLHISVLLLIAYLASLIFAMKQPASVDRKKSGVPVSVSAEAETPAWSRKRSVGTLLGVAFTLAFVSDLLTGSIQPAADSLGLTPVFAGVFLLAMAGNLPQYMNSVSFAAQNRMTLALSINLSSTTQLVMLVAPTLVLVGWLTGQPMNLLFSNFELIGIMLSVFITRNLIADNTSNWLEGFLLVTVYLMLGIGFFYMPA